MSHERRWQNFSIKTIQGRDYLMGFLKKLFFGEEKEKTKTEQQIEENIKAGADYSHAVKEQQVICNGCGTLIEGKPRIMDHQGRTFFLHKRCLKAMKRGELPKPIENGQQNQ